MEHSTTNLEIITIFLQIFKKNNHDFFKKNNNYYFFKKNNYYFFKNKIIIIFSKKIIIIFSKEKYVIIISPTKNILQMLREFNKKNRENFSGVSQVLQKLLCT